MKKNILLLVILVASQLSLLAQKKQPKLSTAAAPELINVFDPEAQAHTWQVALINKSLEEDDARLEQILEQKRELRKSEKDIPEPQVSNKTDVMSAQLGKNFKGCSYDGGNPSDNNLAISNSGYIVVCANSTIDFYDTSGKRLGTFSLSDFAKDNSLTFTFDPKVLYDPVANRFIVVFMNGGTPTESKLVICFSTSDNPKQKWNVYKMKGDLLQDDSWFDYPNIAVSKNDLFISGNLFHLGPFGNNVLNESVLVQIPKKTGYDGGTTLQSEVWSGIVSNGSGDNIYGVLPLPYGQDDNYGPGIYCAATSLGDFTSKTMYIIHVTDDFSSSTKALQVTDIDMTGKLTYSASAESKMKNTTLKLSVGDCRVKSGFYLNGNIHFVFTADIGSSLWSSVIYARYNIAGDKIEFTSVGKQFESYSYPNIVSFGKDEQDMTVCIAYLASANNYYPEIRFAVVDQWLQWSNFVKVKAGETYINTLSGTQRWGDYTGMARWHSSPCRSVWIHGMYGAIGSNNGKEPGNWIGEAINCSTTGINEPAAESMPSKVYPNPAPTPLFYLDFELKKPEFLTIDIINQQGQLVKTVFKQTAPAGQNTIRFSEEMLSSGIYYIQIKNAGGILKNEKLVITK